MRDLFKVSLFLILVAACAPKDSEVYGVKKQLVAYEKLPIIRSPVQVISMDDRIRIIVNTNQIFTNSSAKFAHEYRKMLEPLEDFISNNKLPKSIVVNGYQSGIGNPVMLKELSKKQAEAIAAYIWAIGVPSEIIKVVAYGSSSPVSSSDTASGNIENRRINIDVF